MANDTDCPDHPETVLATARRRLDSFGQWFTETLEPFASSSYPTELASWRKELETIRAMACNLDRVRVALVGSTGAGKSTFLNAVLGQEILPVGVMQPCTAFVTSVSFAPGNTYEMDVHFLTSEEWRRDVENLLAARRPGESEVDGDDYFDSKSLLNAARKRFEAVYDVSFDTLPATASFDSIALPPSAQQIFEAGSKETKRFTEPAEMLGHLRRLIHGEGVLWPLVKQVTIRGPYDCLNGGIELVDLPGLNDPNAARVEVTREYLRTAPFVWLMFSMVRGLTEDVQRILREEKLLRNLVLCGNYHALSLVGTKADDIDANVAEQLGLPEDVEQPELVRAYRSQTVQEARKQLEQLVRDLPRSAGDSEAHERLLQMAREVRVHTTSASAYCKLRKIGRLRRDFGLDDEEDTGIPDVHRHLEAIGKEVGVGFAAAAALQRLDQLHGEIAFFFGARLQLPTPAVEQARTRLQQESSAFRGEIEATRQRAEDRLRAAREQFLEKLQPLLTTSVAGVRHVTEGWAAIHASTLRAIIQGDGVFKSSSTGKAFNFNDELAEPLLARLPVTWEQYFTVDLGRVVDDFVVQLSEKGRSFCKTARLIIELLFSQECESIEKQLGWFQDKVALLADSAKKRVFNLVRQHRAELASKMPLIAKGRMLPAYAAAKGDSGTGMKRRMLGHIQPAALASAEPIFATIQTDLIEGLNDLEIMLVAMFRELVQQAEEQTRLIAHNANIHVEQASTDPAIAALLKSLEDLKR